MFYGSGATEKREILVSDTDTLIVTSDPCIYIHLRLSFHLVYIREGSSIVVIFVLLPDIILGKNLLLIAFACLLQVLKESCKLYRAINDGIISHVDRVNHVLLV